MRREFLCLAMVGWLSMGVCAEPGQSARLVPAAKDGGPGVVMARPSGGAYQRLTQEGTADPGSRVLTDSQNAAAMEFPGGVRAVVSPQATLEYLGLDRGQVQLRVGKGTVRLMVPAGVDLKVEAAGLALLACDAEVEVVADPLAQTRVTCLRGEVTVAGPGGELRKLPTGETVAAGPVGSQDPLTAGGPNPNPGPGGQTPPNQPVPVPQDAWGSLPQVLQYVLPVLLNGGGIGSIPRATGASLPISLPNLPNVPGVPVSLPGFFRILR